MRSIAKKNALTDMELLCQVIVVFYSFPPHTIIPLEIFCGKLKPIWNVTDEQIKRSLQFLHANQIISLASKKNLGNNENHPIGYTWSMMNEKVRIHPIRGLVPVHSIE